MGRPFVSNRRGALCKTAKKYDIIHNIDDPLQTFMVKLSSAHIDTHTATHTYITYVYPPTCYEHSFLFKLILGFYTYLATLNKPHYIFYLCVTGVCIYTPRNI